jgi:hypothetical protein
MQKLTITITFAIIALALGTTTITTTMQIQPAYSQATHCLSEDSGNAQCTTPGKDASIVTCITGRSPPPQEQAGQAIGQQHRDCVQGLGECTVIPPTQ